MTLQKTPSGWSHEAANRQPTRTYPRVRAGPSSRCRKSWLRFPLLPQNTNRPTRCRAGPGYVALRCGLGRRERRLAVVWTHNNVGNRTDTIIRRAIPRRAAKTSRRPPTSCGPERSCASPCSTTSSSRATSTGITRCSSEGRSRTSRNDGSRVAPVPHGATSPSRAWGVRGIYGRGDRRPRDDRSSRPPFRRRRARSADHKCMHSGKQ